MNKLRVIDLLNKIANGEEVPKKIKTEYNDYSYTIWEYNGIDYMNKDNDYLFEIHTRINKNDLNEEIEIIEEDKKIEKIDKKEIEISMSIGEQICANKINEIIDYLNEVKQ